MRGEESDDKQTLVIPIIIQPDAVIPVFFLTSQPSQVAQKLNWMLDILLENLFCKVGSLQTRPGYPVSSIRDVDG